MPSKRSVFDYLCWLWFALLIFGLNSSLHFMSPGLLVFSFVFFFLVDLVLPKIGIIFKVLVAMILVHRTYYVGSFFSPRWLGWLMADISRDFDLIFKAGFAPVMPVTALTLTLLAVLVLQKVFSFLLSRGKATILLLFAGAGILTIAHLWTGTGSAFYIVLYVIVGLALMGTARLQLNPVFPLGRWLSILMIWVIVLSSVAWAMPEGKWELGSWLDRALIWNVPEPFSPPTGRVGYSNYDGVLGAPLEEDNTPVLRVKSPVPVYLRGESRWQYTGSTWQPVLKVTENPEFDLSHLTGEEVSITIEILVGMGSVIFAPRYPLGFQISGGKNLAVFTSTGGGQAFPYEDYEYKSDKALAEGDTYTITALLPRDDPAFLRQLTNSDQDGRYLQLDHNIPQRVLDLAQSVTADAENGYDKAAALVTYLRRGQWSYSLNTQAPPQGQDFVDWFLFEQDRGYCVHFSTAFVILARAAGLPARWVKGFSYGFTDEWGDYIVQNRHAHSWAEVWFDGYGWVPFEPTPGAVLPTIRGSDSDYPGLPGPNNPTGPGNPFEPDYDPGEGTGGGSDLPEAINWKTPLLAGIILAVLVVLVILTVGSLKGYTFVTLYAKLQSRLKLFAWQRHNWETPREHLKRVKDLPDQPVFFNFIQGFEATVYGGADDVRNSPEQRKVRRRFSLWKLAWHRVFRSR